MFKSDMVSIIIACALASIWLATPLWAQEKYLTLGEAISLALANNPELAVEQQALPLARGQMAQARIYPFNPTLDMESGFGIDQEINHGRSRFTYDVQVGVSQVIELKGQRGFRMRLAQANADQAAWQVKDAERRLASNVTRVFSDVLLAQERVQLAGEVVSLSRDISRVAGELFEAGDVPRLDVLRAEVERRRAENELTWMSFRTSPRHRW